MKDNLFEVIHNQELGGIRKLNEEKKYIFVYDIKNKMKEELIDFSDICNFFTYIETLKILNSKYDFKNIIIIINNVEYENDIYRLKDYLFAQAIIANKHSQSLFIGLATSFSINNKDYEIIELEIKDDEIYHCIPIETYNYKSFQNIMPLFCVSSKVSGEFCKDYIQFSNLANTQKSLSSDDFDNIKNLAINYFSDEETTNLPLLNSDEFNNQLTIFESIIKNNLLRFFIDIKGTEKLKLTKSDKVALINIFSDNYKEKFTSRNLLTQFIFSNFLRTLNRNKVLNNNSNQIFKNKISEFFFDLSVIEKCYCDAIAYSEGIYQLLENSILHTRFQILNFTMITYDVRTISLNQNKSLSETHLIKTFQQRKSIQEKFYETWHIPTTDYNVDSYAEFIISDSAFTNRSYEGIIDNYNKKCASNNESIKSLQELFERPLSPDDVSKHYGIQLFEKNLLVNHGVFKLTSANGSEKKGVYEEYTSVIKNGKVERKSISKYDKTISLYSSCYDILFPIKYNWDDISNDQSENENIGHIERWLYEKELIVNKNNVDLLQNCVSEIDKKKISSIINNVKLDNENVFYKENLINRLSDLFMQEYKKLIFSIDFDIINNLQIEIIAKVIFKIIHKRYSLQSDNTQNLKNNTFIALFFNNDEEINEFIRIFSIFYDKSGKNVLYKNVQIALFLKRTNERDIPKIASIIAGSSIEEIYNTALLYSYSNLDTNKNIVDRCKYMVRTITNKDNDNVVTTTPLFPFDLFLPNLQNSYFKRNLEYDLDKNDIRHIDFGLKIENINVRVGSKIHLEEFYEAELLFHNYDIINKFAFIIAYEIEHLFQTQHYVHTRDIMIVGYESYSSLLVQEIVKLLRKYHENGHEEKPRINYCIYTTNDENKEVVEYSPEVMLYKDIEKKTVLNDSLYFTIIPISTTFSTVYKIQNVVNRNLIEKFNTEKPVSFGGHFSLIVVSDTKDTSSYWEFDNSISEKNFIEFTRGIVLRNELNEQNKVYARAFIIVNTNWKSPMRYFDESRKKFDLKTSMVQVDKTSTIPNAVFRMFKNDYDNNDPNNLPYTCFNILKSENDEKVKSLKSFIIYGHICKKDNHYQYYIEKEKYCAAQKESVINWLNLRQNKINSDGFNVIVSPLHNPDSVFLKMVLDNSFSHNYRLIHMPIYDTRRDEIRSKFSYIAKQFMELKAFNSSTKLNFYFIDTSVVTGRTLGRSLSLIRALMSEFNLEEYAPTKFSGIFTIINRSAYNTISKYVDNVFKDYHSYVYLFVPHFNTHNNNCPTCELVKKYTYLVKSSSTNIMSNEYRRLANKHKIRSIEEYKNWLKYQIINSPRYYCWLKQWLYKTLAGFPHNNQLTKMVGDRYDMRNAEKLYSEIRKREIIEFKLKKDINIENLYKLNENAKQLALKDYEIEFQNLGALLFEKYIQNEKCFLRLKTTHDLVEIFEKNNGKDNVEQVKKFEDAILEYLNKQIYGLSISDKIEVAISVIKVASRPLLSQYYHVRQAMQNIITGMLDCFLNIDRDTENDKYLDLVNIFFNKDYKKDIDICLLKYQFLLCLVRRLTDLHSNYFLNKNNLNALISKMLEIKKGYINYAYKMINEKHNNNLEQDKVFDYFIFNRFARDDNIVFTISKIIKWSSMSSDSTSGVFLVNNLLEEGFDFGNE